MRSMRMAWKTVLVSASLAVVACGGGGDDNSPDDKVPPVVVSPGIPPYTDISKAAHQFAIEHPEHAPGQSWENWCGALMFQFCDIKPYDTAQLAYDAAKSSGKEISTDASRAPAGAFHYFSSGTAGHVGVDLFGGGGKVFMATNHLAEKWGEFIGYNSVSGYLDANKGAKYLGWSKNYGDGGGGKCN